MKKNTEVQENLLIIITLLLITLPWIIFNQTKSKSDSDSKNINYEALIKKEEVILRGKLLFKNEGCYSCHKPDKKQTLNLTNNLLKRRDKDYLISFIKNEDSLLKAKHPIAIALKEQYNGANGKHNSKLSKEKIMDMFYFLENYD